MSSPRLFSILRRKPGLIDFITPIRPQTEGVEGYRLFTDTNPGGGFGLTAATGTLTLTGNVTAGDQVTIGTKTYTFTSPLGPADGDVLRGAAATNSLDNLISAINNAPGGAGSGVLWAAATTANGFVSAVAGAGDTMVVTALVAGPSGNLIATTVPVDAGGVISWGGLTLSGSTGSAVLTAPRTGLVDPAVQGNQHVIQPGENVRMIFKPSNFGLPDSGVFWVKLGYVDGGGLDMVSPAPSAVTLVLPPPTGGVQSGFTGTAPLGANLAASLQIDLPRSMENLRIRNLELATPLHVAFDPGGPEIQVPGGQETVAWTGLISTIFVRGAGATAAFTATFSPAFPK